MILGKKTKENRFDLVKVLAEKEEVEANKTLEHIKVMIDHLALVHAEAIVVINWFYLCRAVTLFNKQVILRIGKLMEETEVEVLFNRVELSEILSNLHGTIAIPTPESTEIKNSIYNRIYCIHFANKD